MTFFSRRRIQSMVCDLTSHLEGEKRTDIVKRLNSKDPEQCVGAEIELAIAWSLRSLDLEIEPFWWAEGRSPDAYVEGLLPGKPAAIEVTAFAEAAISGETQMDHCAQVLSNIADAERRGSGRYLYFHFAETRHYRRGRYEREIAAPKCFAPSRATVLRVQEWVRSAPDPKARLIIKDDGLSVELEMRTQKQIRYHNYHVSRPPRTYSDTRNPLYRRLADKAKQVANAPSGVCRIIILVEAGSRFLAETSSRRGFNSVESYSTAQDIIQKVIKDKSDKLDAIIVLIPTVEHARPWRGRTQPEKYWSTHIFSTQERDSDPLAAAVESIIKQLPSPRFDGYNVRSLIRQKAMQHDARGWYRGTNISMQDNKLTYRMSSRALQDFLASRIDETQFRRFIGEQEDGPSIKRFLDQGYTIQGIQFEAGGVDDDDDCIVLEFARDAAASPFE
ncbi:hypothetical protein [Tritonibacter sp. SIMBA_163]|uniref:hypothetical protein n=1 Tax=Tritonibacter sp. SIMBA_163 TaxID=3080868 RepID=UPI00397F6885